MLVTFNNVEFSFTCSGVRAKGYHVDTPVLLADQLDCALMSLKTGPVLLDSELCSAIDEARENVDALFSVLTNSDADASELAKSYADAVFNEIDLPVYADPDEFLQAMHAGGPASTFGNTYKKYPANIAVSASDYRVTVLVDIDGKQFSFSRDYSC